MYHRCLGVIVGLLVWLFEVGMRALNTDTHNMGNVMWDTLGRPVQMRDYRLASFPANLTAILWSFLVFILMVIYSANLTANLTVSQFKNDIRGLEDLPGKAVAAFEGHQEELKKYNIAAMGMPWNGKEDEIKMINTLKSGLVKALVFDSSLLEIYDATDCDTMLVGDYFDLRDQCVAFSPNTWQNYPGFTDAFDIAMLTVVQGTGGIEELIDRFITVPPAACKSSDLSSGYSSVTLSEVAGLWVILCIAIGVSGLIVIFYRLWGAKIGPWAEKKGWYNSKHSEKIKSSYQTLKRAGFSQEVDLPYGIRDKSKDGVNDSFQYRYAGASKGYVDGSTDIFPHGVPASRTTSSTANTTKADSKKLKEGYFTKRRKNFVNSGKLVVDPSINANNNTTTTQQNGNSSSGINGEALHSVTFASGEGTAATATAAAAATAVAAPNVTSSGVSVPNDSAIIESPRSFPNRMVTFRLDDADYTADGDARV
jgi:hypothetical protein